MLHAMNRNRDVLEMIAMAQTFKPSKPAVIFSHAEMLSFNRLQYMALFYRVPVDAASAGGYTRLFTAIPLDCPPTVYDNQQRAMWEEHWKKIDGLPQKVRDCLCSDIPIRDLARVTDVPDEYLKTL